MDANAAPAEIESVHSRVACANSQVSGHPVSSPGALCTASVLPSLLGGPYRRGPGTHTMYHIYEPSSYTSYFDCRTTEYCLQVFETEQFIPGTGTVHRSKKMYVICTTTNFEYD